MRFYGRRYYCNVCNNTITKDEYNYSMNKFNKPLCREHRNSYSSPRKIMSFSKPTSDKSTPEARKLYNALRERGIPAKPEKWDGHKHIDIGVPSLKFNIEVEGMQHAFDSKQALSDMKRDYYSERKGFATIRVQNSALRENFSQTLMLVLKRIDLRRKEIEAEEDEDDEWF